MDFVTINTDSIELYVWIVSFNKSKLFSNTNIMSTTRTIESVNLTEYETVKMNLSDHIYYVMALTTLSMLYYWYLKR